MVILLTELLTIYIYLFYIHNIHKYIYIYLSIYLSISLSIYIYTYIYIYIYIYKYCYHVIMKTMCGPGYHYIGLWQLMYLGTWCTVMCTSAWVATKPLGDNQKDTLFSWWHICYAHFASVRFEHSVCCGSLMTTSSVLQIFIYFHCFKFF